MGATRESERRQKVALAKVVKVLTRGKFITIVDIARLTKCSRVAAYKRVDALRERGCSIKSAIMPRVPGRRGPDVAGFQIVENRVSRSVLKEGSVTR